MFPVDEEEDAVIEVCVVVVDMELLNRDVVVTLQTTDGSATC